MPKPTALKVLHGDRTDRINRAEPIPPEREVIAPEELSTTTARRGTGSRPA
jgi:hypothetical protein